MCSWATSVGSIEVAPLVCSAERVSLNHPPLDGSGEGARDHPSGVGAIEGGMGQGYVFTRKPARKGSIEVAPLVCSAERASLNRPPLVAQKYRLLMKMKNNLSNSTLSSNFYDGKGDGLFLSNGERPNPFPEHKLLNGDEVELNLFGKTTDAAYIPKAKTNSSKRIKTASLPYQANDSVNNKLYKKIALKKSRKQVKHLFHVGTHHKTHK